MNCKQCAALVGLMCLTANSAVAQEIPPTIWSKTFGGGGFDYGSSVQETSDGGFILLGHTESFGAGDSDFWLVKTDRDGNQLWNKTFGGSSWDIGDSVQETSGGGFILLGTTDSF